jgi:hypothetical protein
MVDGALRRIA